MSGVKTLSSRLGFRDRKQPLDSASSVTEPSVITLESSPTPLFIMETGLTVSPAMEGREGLVPTGARIDELGVTREAAWPTSTPLKPGDLLADINGQDVRGLPFSEVLRLLNAPTPHVITTTCNTTTTIGSMFGSSNSSSGSGNGSFQPHPHPPHPGNVTKRLRGTQSAASVGPRTPGSSTKTAPSSTSQSIAPSPLAPPSPAVLPPLSPRRLGSIRTTRLFAPLLTDVRRVSWRRKGSSKWGSGKDSEGKANDGKDMEDRAVSAVFFSSPGATPKNASSSSSSVRAAPLNPWGGGTPGGKPSRLSRTRSMFSSAFGKLSPRATRTPRSAVRAFAVVGNDAGKAPPSAASPAPAPATPSPSCPSVAPPSPAGSSPSDKEEVSGVSPADVSPAPSTSTGVRYLPPSSPTTPRTGRQELLAHGAAAADADATWRGGSVRLIPLSCEGDSATGGLIYDDVEKDGGENKSSPAFFASDAEHEDEGGHAEEGTEQEEGQGEEDKQRGRPSAADEDEVARSCTLSRGQSDHGTRRRQQGPQQVDTEVPIPEQEEEEIVALASYLASARRDCDWPWMGRDVLWAEYISLNGHHRWIRSEKCRHALLLVRGALYLLELPKDAVARHVANVPTTRARESWYMQLNASDLSHLSVPLPSAQSGRTVLADRLGAGSGLVLHKRGGVGACAWVECRNTASRDALVDHVRAWAKPEATGKGREKGARGKERSLRVELCPVAQLASGLAGADRKGKKIPSLTDERQACPLW